MRPVTPLVAVDLILRIEDYVNLRPVKYLFIKHKETGKLAIPGGTVDVGESCKGAACRELLEETGVKVFPWQLKFVDYFDAPDRDPRGHVISMVFTATKYITENDKLGLNFDLDVVNEESNGLELLSEWNIRAINEDEFRFDHQDIMLRAFNKMSCTW